MASERQRIEARLQRYAGRVPNRAQAGLSVRERLQAVAIMALVALVALVGAAR